MEQKPNRCDIIEESEKYRIDGELHLYVSVYKGFICVHLRKIDGSGKYGSGVSMTPWEWRSFMSLTSYSTTTIGRISMAKTKGTVTLTRTEDMAKSSDRREVVLSNKTLAIVKSYVDQVAQNIKSAQVLINNSLNNTPTLDEIVDVVVALGVKMYAKLRKTSCLACAEGHLQQAQLVHTCIEEDEERIMERITQSVSSIQADMVTSVYAASNLYATSSYVGTNFYVEE